MASMEDFNQPSPERVVLLERLQELAGGTSPHFWAACQICDMKVLEKLVLCGEIFPVILQELSLAGCAMAGLCK